MDRRTFVKGAVGAGTTITFAGCLDDSSGGSGPTDTPEPTDEPEATETPEPTATEQPKIIVGSDIPYKPFEWETTGGDYTGFDVDIAGAIFEGQLGREYEFKATGWDTIIPSLNNGNFRLIMSAMTITDKRAKKVDFSEPYFSAYQTVAILDNSDITELDDLKGKTVAVQKGTTGEGAAEELQAEFDGDLTIDSYDQITGAFNALLNNQAVAVINDNTVNAQYVSDRDSIVFLEGDGKAAEQGKDAPPYLTLTVEEYGIAFRQDDDEFREQVNDALAAIKEDGTYDEIYNEYFA